MWREKLWPWGPQTISFVLVDKASPGAGPGLSSSLPGFVGLRGNEEDKNNALDAEFFIGVRDLAWEEELSRKINILSSRCCQVLNLFWEKFFCWGRSKERGKSKFTSPPRPHTQGERETLPAQDNFTSHNSRDQTWHPPLSSSSKIGWDQSLGQELLILQWKYTAQLKTMRTQSCGLCKTLRFT